MGGAGVTVPKWRLQGNFVESVFFFCLYMDLISPLVINS